MASSSTPPVSPLSISITTGPDGTVTPPLGTPTPSAYVPKELDASVLTIVVLGASGDLARKKTFPALYALFLHGLLPVTSVLMGYARSKIARADFHAKLQERLAAVEGSNPDALAVFLSMVFFASGQYDDASAFAALDAQLVEMEDANGGKSTAHRLFYLALPPSVFAMAAAAFQPVAMSKRGWNRIVVEKPFGHDLASSNELVGSLSEIFEESQTYRVDHYLQKTAVDNLMVFRFANLAFQPLWRRDYIKCVIISFKEDFGTEGRGGYFDKIGIMRDVMQNHLLQVLSLVAMERPTSLTGEDIRDEKVKVLRSIKPLSLDDVLIGQYVGNADGKPGYTDDAGVPDDSKAATYAIAAFNICNERWDGVPFIIRCGKALNERKADIRIQFRDVPGQLFDEAHRNELVFRIQPEEAIYLKMIARQPGLGDGTTQTELDLSFRSRFNDVVIPEAYERLLYDVLNGDRSHFVRADELEAAWTIFDDVLHRLDDGEKEPIPYVYGTRGPSEADTFMADHGYIRNESYTWSGNDHRLDV